MIKQLIEPQFLRDRTAELIAKLRQQADLLANPPAEVRERAERHNIHAQDLKETIHVLEDALAAEGSFARKEREAAWLPRIPALGVVQTALEEFYRQSGAVDDAAAKQHGLTGEVPAITDLTLKEEWLPTTQRGLFKQMEQYDLLGWGLSFAVASGIKLAKGKHPFRERPATERPIPIQNSVRLVLVGDWASGIPRARQVARQMRKRLLEAEASGRQGHVVHLGDVYYAGRSFEYVTHLHDCWPVADGEAGKIGSWNLNANHDMFTGGHGFYEHLDTDERFKPQGGFSYFALENDHWLIVGLDTAWESTGIKGDFGGLKDPQADWLTGLRDQARGKRLMLLSHQQLFSPYEGDSPLLMQRLEGLLNRAEPIDAWFWGHEHRCAVYEPSHNILYPSLIGHGGVPVFADSSPVPHGVRFEYKGKLPGGLIKKHAMLGFAVVDLDGRNGEVRYVNEENIAHEKHDLPAP